MLSRGRASGGVVGSVNEVCGMIGTNTAQLTVEISLAERGHGRCDHRIFVRPIKPGESQEAHRAAIRSRCGPSGVSLLDHLTSLRRCGSTELPTRRGDGVGSAGGWAAADGNRLPRFTAKCRLWRSRSGKPVAQ